MASVSRMTPSRPRAAPETRHARERKSRERRAAQLKQLRATAETLEYVLLVLPSVYDSDGTVWEAILDPDALRLRKFLLCSLRLSEEARELVGSKNQFKRLLYEHRVASLMVTRIQATSALEDWEESVRRRRSITLNKFRPWSIEECEAEIEIAQKQLNAFLWSMDTREIGSNFMGWRVRRRMTRSRDVVQFSFEKTFRGYPMSDFVQVGWQLYTDLDKYNKLAFNGRAHGWLEVVQKITSDMWIVRCTERHPAMLLDAHTIFLVSRTKTERGVTQFVRTLCVPEVQKETCHFTDVWATNSVWLQWDRLNDEGTEYRAHLGGKLAAIDAKYAEHWLIETLAVMLRMERMATKKMLVFDDDMMDVPVTAATDKGS